MKFDNPHMGVVVMNARYSWISFCVAQGQRSTESLALNRAFCWEVCRSRIDYEYV